MPSHEIKRDWKARLKSAVPFGIGQRKPKHFRYMAAIVWQNRDNLPYAWKVLSRGVCDGCALGVAGFHDWTIEGIHLCMTRLNLLRLNTMPAFDVSLLADLSKLRNLDNAQLRELGRLAYPVLREKNAPGFHRISWDEAYQRIGAKLRATDSKRFAFFLTARGITNEVYYMAQKAARFLGTNNVDNAARLCHAPSTAAMKHAVGVAATTCSYKDWYGTDLIVFFGANPACVSYAGHPVSRPLGPEEDLVRALIDAMGPQVRSAAVVAGQPPADIRTGTSPRASQGIEPSGVPATGLGPAARALLAQLVALYLDRLPAELADRQAARLGGSELHFAWEGRLTPGARHYYRVQGDDLLIEYDTTADGNHAHTVLRRPRSDFGDDILAAHYARAHS